jgi:predicted TIM-barrel fold metal-dependent hydrolase
MIFDAHTHIGECDPFHYSASEETVLSISTERLISEMDRNSVTSAVVMPNFHLPHRLGDANLELASSISRFRDRLFAFAWLDPRIEGCCEQLEMLVETHGFRGLKLHPVLGGYYISNKIVHPLIERTIRLDIPVMIHTGWGNLGNASYVGSLAEKFPDAKFIIAHMIDPECLNVAKKNPNIYLETSYAQHPRKITQATQDLSSDRLIYGSDYPLGGGMKFELSKIMLADINEKDKRMILGGNIQGLIK